MEFFQKSEMLTYVLNKQLSFMLRYGMLILFFLLVTGVGVTYFVFIPDTVTGQFELTTSNPPKSIASKTNG